MRLLVIGALLVIMPFSGIRVICVELPADASGATATAPAEAAPAGTASAETVSAETASDCERLCALRKPVDAPPAPQAKAPNGSDCALSADACSLIAFTSIAVTRQQEPLPVPFSVSVAFSESPRFHLEPDVARLEPPPKLQVL